MGADFRLQLKSFAEKTKGRIDQVTRKVVFEMGSSLVFKSPVGDGSYWINKPPPGYVGGRFRANWQLGVGAIDYTTSEAVDPTGDSTLGDLFAKVADEPAAQVFYLTNSLPYAQRLEDGWSHRQAPNGMVALTVLEFRQFVSNAVREAKS